MLPSFTLLLQRRPPSGQKGPNPKFKNEVAEQARRVWAQQPMFTGDLYARVTWLYKPKRDQDIDSIPKRVLDCLCGIVFQDDRIVTQTLATAIDLTKDYVIREPVASGAGIDDNTYQELLRLLSDPTVHHVLYIEIGQLEVSTVEFGAIDRRGS